MRYRPFGAEGRSISALTLALDETPRRPADRRRLVHAALEAGINAFELRGREMMDTAAGLGEALSSLPREAVVVALRLPPDPRQGNRPFTREWIIHAVERTIASAGLEQLDLLTFDLPHDTALDDEAREAAEAAKAAGRIAMIGIAGDAAALDDAMGWPGAAVMTAPYSLLSGWPERNRLKMAASLGLIVIGSDFHPPTLATGRAGAPRPAARRGLFGLMRKAPPLEQADGYAFLQRTRGWTAAELCLAYALTEPGLASVIVKVDDPKVLAGLAQAPERDLPNGFPAQIEMARFSPG